MGINITDSSTCHKHLLHHCNKPNRPKVPQSETTQLKRCTTVIHYFQPHVCFPFWQLSKWNLPHLGVQVYPYNKCLITSSPYPEMNALPHIGCECCMGVQSKAC